MKIIARLEDLPPGKVLHFEARGVPALLINDRGKIRAFLNICPHRGGQLMFDESTGIFRCQEHHSTWNLDGTQNSPPEVDGTIDYEYLAQSDIICLIPIEIEIRGEYILGPG